MNTPTKLCRKCNEEFPATTEFFNKCNAKGSISNECKRCQSARHKAWREKRTQNPIIRTFKHCPLCNLDIPLDDDHFSRNKGTSDGYYGFCKSCRSKSRNMRYLSDPVYASKERERSRNHFYNHIDAHREKRKSQYRSNPQKAIDDARQWRLDHPERYREQQRNYKYHHYRANRESYRVYCANRRARMKQVSGAHSTDDIKRQYKAQRGKCYYCGAKVGGKYHVDHVVPISRGGDNSPSNLVITCPHCNLSKNDRLPHEWPQGGRLL